MPFQQLYKNIFERNESATGKAATMEAVTKAHPYFSLAHFFLLKEADTKEAAYAKNAAKTALHFNNTFLLHSQLHKDLLSEQAALIPVNVAANEEVAPELFVVEEVSDDVAAINVETLAPLTDEIQATTSQNDDVAGNEITEEEVAADKIPVDEIGVISDDSKSATSENEDAELPELPEDTLAVAETQATEEAPKSSTAPGTEILAAAEVAPEELQPKKVEQVDPAFLKMPTLGAAVPGVEGTLLFTPLYATDYFASQGIKLREEALPNDKLGKQLKSFTDWLKTMKKVHDSKLPAGSEVMDASVQKLAEKSNKEEEVITETMAEVFLQQGKLHKAKEIYEKLSLLSPSKIAYFAAKIDQIQKK